MYRPLNTLQAFPSSITLRPDGGREKLAQPFTIRYIITERCVVTICNGKAFLAEIASVVFG